MKRESKQFITLTGLLVAILSYLLFGNPDEITIGKNTYEFIHTTSTQQSTASIVSSDNDEEPEREAPAGYELVTRIVDGDTIELENGQKVRYIGVNTPESVDPRQGVQCFGKEAAQYNADMVLDKYVRLERDAGNTDRYGRLLRYVYLEDGTFVNLKIVQDGYAQVMTIPPNVKHSQLFLDAQKEAREAGRGLWGACK